VTSSLTPHSQGLCIIGWPISINWKGTIIFTLPLSFYHLYISYLGIITIDWGFRNLLEKTRCTSPSVLKKDMAGLHIWCVFKPFQLVTHAC
jgi:hypothetical protein